MVKTPANPGGLPIEVLDGLRQQLAANRAQFYLEFASGPFYGFNRPGAQGSQAVIQNWWRQGMAGGAKAHYDGIKAFSETGVALLQRRLKPWSLSLLSNPVM
jgi:non-heme chloroperoxidase